jgi:hypothetical protein
MAQRLAHQFQPVEDFDRPDDMRRVRTLPSPHFEPTALPTTFQQPI